MSETQRKIELQSPEDLRYLINNAKRAASEKIDRAFPPMANQGEDAMKLKVKELVDEYIHQTFQLSTPSISISGLPATLPHTLPETEIQTEVYEPLNAKLQARALELARQEEDLLIEIAALRREVPGRVVELNKGVFKEGVEGDEEGLKRVLDGVKVEGMDLVEGVEGVGGEVEEVWRRGVSELGGLRDELPGTAQRLGEARRAGEFVGGG